MNSCPASIEEANSLLKFHSESNQLRDAQCLIILGGHDPRVAHYAAEVLKSFRFEHVFIVGGLGKFSKMTFGQPEAIEFKNIISSYGIDTASYVVEKESTNTGENFKYIRAELQKREIKDSFILSRTNVLKRVYATTKLICPFMKIGISAPQLDLNEIPVSPIDLHGVINELVGDTQRMLEYPKKGFQVEVDIPAEVLDSYQRLRELGFVENLL